MSLLDSSRVSLPSGSVLCRPAAWQNQGLWVSYGEAFHQDGVVSGNGPVLSQLAANDLGTHSDTTVSLKGLSLLSGLGRAPVCAWILAQSSPWHVFCIINE